MNLHNTKNSRKYPLSRLLGKFIKVKTCYCYEGS